jgi:hypothetical protein
VSASGRLRPDPWLRTAGWRGGSWLVGIVLLLVFLAVVIPAFDIGGWWQRLALVGFIGFLMSAPYGVAWVRGNPPAPPRPAVLVPSTSYEGPQGNTYVIVGPHPAVSRRGLGRKAQDLGPLAWFFYTILWRWPLLVGDAVLSFVWSTIKRIFGFNSGPSSGPFDPSSIDEIHYPEDLPPPGSQTF